MHTHGYISRVSISIQILVHMTGYVIVIMRYDVLTIYIYIYIYLISLLGTTIQFINNES